MPQQVLNRNSGLLLKGISSINSQEIITFVTECESYKLRAKLGPISIFRDICSYNANLRVRGIGAMFLDIFYDSPAGGPERISLHSAVANQLK